MRIAKAKRIVGEIGDIPADKSISHRCAIFALLAKKPSEIGNFLCAKDTLSTLNIAKELGLEVRAKDSKTMLFIPPKEGIKEPRGVLDCGNAGTAMRLYTGLLAGVRGHFVLSGDKYLNNRPMKRVIEPLQKCGAKISARANGELAPIAIEGSALRGFCYQSPIASAQVKGAMLLAGLFAGESSVFSEPFLSRNHTEILLQNMGADIRVEAREAQINQIQSQMQASQIEAGRIGAGEMETATAPTGKILINPLDTPLNPLVLDIPSDPSSAFFFAVAATLLPHSHIVLKNILLNPTRIEGFEVLKKMGAKITYTLTQTAPEAIGDISVESSALTGIEVSENIPWLIDEIPALSIAFACAKGKSVIKNAKELRVKESDRIHAIAHNLTKMGIEIEELDDGFTITGGELRSAQVSSFGDHRIAMSFAIAGLLCGVEIEDFDCVGISFPNFLEILRRIQH